MIEIQNVSKTFVSGRTTVEALHDVNISIGDGSIFGIIGLSGAGKSTLVRCINMLERPTSGEVYVDGQNMGDLAPSQLRAARRGITMIFQQFNLLMQKNCLANVCFPMELAGGRVQPLLFDPDVLPLRVNLVPLVRLLDFLHYGSRREILLNIVGNVAM
ncbi:MAG: ATP-binding cassette domain-containing protein, partial [Firmicutes bacterium]|nr:ATP-binding cassette domain-containing protein [Bacillota bacterium]